MNKNWEDSVRKNLKGKDWVSDHNLRQALISEQVTVKKTKTSAFISFFQGPLSEVIIRSFRTKRFHSEVDQALFNLTILDEIDQRKVGDSDYEYRLISAH